MIAIPFVYFSIFLFYTINRKGLCSITTLLVGFYAITSLGAIGIDFCDAYSTNCPKTEITIVPTFLYCLLHTIVIWPFLKYRDNCVTSIKPLVNEKILDYLVYFYFASFMFEVIFLTPDLIRCWALGAADSHLKDAIAAGEFKTVSLTGILGKVAFLSLFLSVGSLSMIFVFFYNLAFRKKKVGYHIMCFLGTLTILFQSILRQDRSRFIYWIMLFVLCFVIYYNFLTSQKRKVIRFSFIAMVSLVIVYSAIMSMRRFGERGTFDNENFYLLNYAGQSFINFCNFYEHLNLPYIYWDGPFPFTSWILHMDDMNTPQWAAFILQKTGVNILVFASYIGVLFSYVGVPITIVLCCLYSLVINKVVISRKNIGQISVYRLYLLFALLLEPYLGIFGHYYHSVPSEICSVVFLYLFYQASYKTSLKTY